MVVFGAVLTACTISTPGTGGKQGSAPALAMAMQLEQSGSRDFAKGNWRDASESYQQAANVYASVALTDPQVGALLNLAKVQAAQGNDVQAEYTVSQTLGFANVSPSLQILANGRMAALLMERDPVAAEKYLRTAQSQCQHCAEAAALHTLSARLAMKRSNPKLAEEFATLALSTATTPLDRANALRSRAQAKSAQLNGWENAAQDALNALQLDQDLAMSERVILDLQVLVSIYRASGNVVRAESHDKLLQQAQAANKALKETAP